MTRKARTTTPLADCLWRRVNKGNPDECWPWTVGIKNNGYGIISRGRAGTGNVGTHVAAYEISKGPIPDGFEIDHRCHRPDECSGGWTCPHRACCNPAHLDAVPRSVNLSRARRVSGNARKTHCPRGHAYTADNLLVVRHGRSCKACKREKYRALRAS